MAHNKTRQDNKLMLLRVLVLAIIAYLLVKLNIVNDGNSSNNINQYIFALIMALPITMLLDKYIVQFSKNGSLK